MTQNQKQSVIILYGGPSVEHEVSIISAQTVIDHLDAEKYDIVPCYIDHSGRFFVSCAPDACAEKKHDPISRLDSLKQFLDFPALKSSVLFNACHGTFGENGALQGFIEMLDLPYTGDDILCSGICFDKAVSKALLKQSGLPVIEGITYHKGEPLPERLPFPYPVFVKPSNCGSSVGVTRVAEEKELRRAIDIALQYDTHVLIEKEIRGPELQIGVIGRETLVASRPGVYGIADQYAFFDYDAKYTDDRTQLLIPFEGMSEETEARARALAVQAATVLRVNSYARVDIFLSLDGELIINEINTSPGMTSHSMFPQLWRVTQEHCLPTIASVLDEIIAMALQNHQAKSALTYQLN